MRKSTIAESAVEGDDHPFIITHNNTIGMQRLTGFTINRALKRHG